MYQVVLRKNKPGKLGAGAMKGEPFGHPVKTKGAATRRAHLLLNGDYKVDGKGFRVPRGYALVVEEVPKKRRSNPAKAPAKAKAPTKTCTWGGKRYMLNSTADRLKRENGMAGRRNNGKNEGRATVQWTHNMDRYVYLSPMERRSNDGLGAVLVWDKAQTLWKLSIMMPDGTFYEDVLSRSVAFGDRQKALDIATEMVMNTAILHLGG